MKHAFLVLISIILSQLLKYCCNRHYISQETSLFPFEKLSCRSYSPVYLGFIIAIHWVRKLFFAIFRVPYRKLKSNFSTINPLQVVRHLELRGDFLNRE